MSGIGFGAMLLSIWLLLWGAFSVANVVSGVLVVALVVGLLRDVPFRHGRPVLRPVAILRFAAVALLGVVRANAVLTREIITRRSSINTGVVAVPLPLCGDGLLTLIANVLALTPGTMPVEVTDRPPVIYVHVLHLRDVETVRREVQHLTELAVRAFGSPEAVAALTVGEAP